MSDIWVVLAMHAHFMKFEEQISRLLNEKYTT